MGKRAQPLGTTPSPSLADKRICAADAAVVPKTDPDNLSFEELRSYSASKIRQDSRVDGWLSAWNLLVTNQDETLPTRARDFAQRLFDEPTITTRRMVLKVPEFTVALLGLVGAPKRLQTRALTEKEEWLRHHLLTSPRSPIPPKSAKTVNETQTQETTVKTSVETPVETPVETSSAILTSLAKPSGFTAIDLWTFLQTFGQWYGATLLERAMSEVFIPGTDISGVSVETPQLWWGQSTGKPLPVPHTMLSKMTLAPSTSSTLGIQGECVRPPLGYDSVEAVQDVFFDLRLDSAALRKAVIKTFERYPQLPGPRVYDVDMSAWMLFVCWTLFHGLPLFCVAERQALLATACAMMPSSTIV